MLEKKCGIYAYKDVVNNKYVYVGQTQQPFPDRDKQHRTSPINNLMNNKLKAYPMQFIMCPLIFFDIREVDVSILNDLEEFFISILDTYNNGYNLTLGGKSYVMMPEHKKKISAALKGRTLSQEHRKKVSQNHARLSGPNHPNYGKRGANAYHTKYTLWDSHVCQYDKRKKVDKNLSKSFQLVYNTYRVPIGMFLDFISISIIAKMIEDFEAEGGF